MMKVWAVVFFIISIYCAYSAVYHELWLHAKERANADDMCNSTYYFIDNGKVEKHTEEDGTVWWYFYDKTPEGYKYHGKTFRLVAPSNPYFGKITMRYFGYWVVETVQQKENP